MAELPINYLDTGKVARDKINDSFNKVVATVEGYRPHIESGIRWIGTTNTGVKAVGDSIEMKVESGYIWYKSSSVNTRTQIIAVADLKGDKGDPGTPGTPGAAATITVGTTTTGDAGTSASVSNSGTSSAAVLNFTIPKGAKGDPGQDGEDGEDGTAATITVGTTTTLPAGSSATVTNSGTSSAAVLNFGIPKGDTGTGTGDVSGPSSSTDGNIALFDGTTGKLIEDSGHSLSEYQTTGNLKTSLSDDSDSYYPSQKAVKTAVDAKQDALTAQTAYTSKGSATKVPQITTNALGQVTAISEVDISVGDSIEYVTSAEYTALLPGAESDGKHYFIYEEYTPPTPLAPSTFNDSFTGTTLNTTIWSSEQLGSGGSLVINNGLTISSGSTRLESNSPLFGGHRIYTNATYQGTETKITAEVTFTGITGDGNMGGTFTILGHECGYGTYDGNPVIDGVTGMEYTTWNSHGYRLCKMNSAGTGGDDTASYTMFNNGDVVKVVLDITNNKSELYVNGTLKCIYDPVLSSAKTWNSYVGQPLLTISPLFSGDLGDVVWNISNVKLTTE